MILDLLRLDVLLVRGQLKMGKIREQGDGGGKILRKNVGCMGDLVWASWMRYRIKVL
jgi:hypothetical protein